MSEQSEPEAAATDGVIRRCRFRLGQHFSHDHPGDGDQIPALGEALRATAQAHKDADEARKGSSAPRD